MARHDIEEVKLEPWRNSCREAHKNIDRLTEQGELVIIIDAMGLVDAMTSLALLIPLCSETRTSRGEALAPRQLRRIELL
jgi:putative exporter of polyketide antibiotics